MSTTSLNPDIAKRAQLRRHKTLATGLFLLMTAVYMTCMLLMKHHAYTWTGYVKAFSEAAMVGALADWFAVTALFHHPLGLPIPHTNLIEEKKKNIGDNLGGFVVSNFLNPFTIRPYIEKINVAQIAAQWLLKEKNVDLIVTEGSRMLKDIVQKADDTTITAFITDKSRELLGEIKLNEVAAAGLEMVLQRGDQERIINFLVEKLKLYIGQNEEMIKERVKEESHFLIPGFVDNIIASKITKGFASYLTEIENDNQHKIRKDIHEQLQRFIGELKGSEKWQQELQGVKDELLGGDKLQQYAVSVWKRIQAGITGDLTESKSAIRTYFKKVLDDMARSLSEDRNMQQKINSWIQLNSYKYILHNAPKVGELISNTVGNWEGKELSNKLELEVGKDLQFIRINGTLVGGLVGLVIYTVTKIAGLI